MNNVRTLVTLRKATNKMFTKKATSKPKNNNDDVLPTASIAFCAAACPKYGSITAAFKLNLWFNPARIGRNVDTRPPDPTLRIK